MSANRTIITLIFTWQIYASIGDWFVLFDKTEVLIGESKKFQKVCGVVVKANCQTIMRFGKSGVFCGFEMRKATPLASPFYLL